jgi:anti-sigma B factor antagonist
MTEDARVRVDVRAATADTYFIDIHGDLTSAGEGALMDAYARASGEGARVLILNFGDLDYMNSSGIGLLVTLLIRARRHQQRLLTCGVSDHYKQIFELTRLDEAIGIHDSEAEALAAAGVS